MKRPMLDRTKRKAPPRRSAGDPKLIRKVTAHVERHLGRVSRVFYDLLSDVVHVDMLCVEAGAGRNFHAVVTCGMSERPLPASDPRRERRYAELVLRLPSSWPLDPIALNTEASFWPLRELEHLARAPHIFEADLWGGHTVGNPGLHGGLEPLCSATRFCGSVLGEPSWTPSRFRRLRVDRRRKLRFFSVIPLYAEELVLAHEQGSDRLFQHLRQAGVTDLLDPGRPNLLGQLG